MSYEQNTSVVTSNVKRVEGSVEKMTPPVSQEGLPWDGIEEAKVEALSIVGGVDQIPNADGGVDEVRRSGTVTLSTNELYGKNVYIRIPGNVISGTENEPDRIFTVAGDGRGGALMTEVTKGVDGRWISDPDSIRMSGKGSAITAGRSPKNSTQLAGNGISSKHFSITGGMENGELSINSDALNGLEVIIAPIAELTQAPAGAQLVPENIEPTPPSIPVIAKEGGRSGMGVISGVDFKGDPRRVPGHPSNPTNDIRQAAVDAARRLEVSPMAPEQTSLPAEAVQPAESPRIEQAQKPDIVAEAMTQYPQGVLVERSGGAIMLMKILPDRERTGFKRGTTESVTEPIPDGFVLVEAQNGDTRLVALVGLESSQAGLESKLKAIQEAEDSVVAAQSEQGSNQELVKSNQEVAWEQAHEERLKLSQDEQVAVWKFASDLKWSLSFDPKNYNGQSQAMAQAADKRRQIKTDAGIRVAEMYERALRIKD